MDKLTLEHLAPYLPYGLKMNSHGRIYTLDGFIIESALNVQDKPLLRPLSQLTQEIEHNGERFVPLVELYKLSVDDDILYYKIVTQLRDPELFTTGIRVLDSCNEYRVLSFSITNGFATQECGDTDIIDKRKVVLTLKQMLLFQKLHEWHFDTANLLGRGLAVEIKEGV